MYPWTQPDRWRLWHILPRITSRRCRPRRPRPLPSRRRWILLALQLRRDRLRWRNTRTIGRRLRLSLSPRTPPATLWLLAPYFPQAIARHPNASPETLLRVATWWRDVMENPSLPLICLERPRFMDELESASIPF
jgi:hypothetical protein